jgi:hypothetical protein
MSCIGSDPQFLDILNGYCGKRMDQCGCRPSRKDALILCFFDSQMIWP